MSASCVIWDGTYHDGYPVKGKLEAVESDE